MNKTALNPISILSIFGVMCLSMGFSSIGPSTGSASVVYSQRCGGTLDYLVRDEKGELLSADLVEAKVLEIMLPSGAHATNLEFYLPSYLHTSVRYARTTEYSKEDLERAPKSLRFRTGCGVQLIKVALEYRNKRMVLVFRNVPSEANFYVDSLPFQAGKFEIKCGPGGVSYEVLGRLSPEELDKDETLKKLKAAQVVSAKRWKK